MLDLVASMCSAFSHGCVRDIYAKINAVSTKPRWQRFASTLAPELKGHFAEGDTFRQITSITQVNDQALQLFKAHSQHSRDSPSPKGVGHRMQTERPLAPAPTKGRRPCSDHFMTLTGFNPSQLQLFESWKAESKDPACLPASQ